MRAVELPIRVPKVTLLSFGSLAVLGLLYLSLIHRQEDPDFDWRSAEVIVPYPGADPETCEQLIAKPLEAEVAEIDELEWVRTASREGVAYLRMALRQGSDYKKGFDRLREKVSELARTLPPGAGPPRVIDGDDLIKTSALLIAVSAREGGEPHRRDPLSLLHYARDLERALERIPAVESVELHGAPPDVIEVRVDLERLSKWKVDPRRLQAALAARNLRAPTGSLELGAHKVLVDAAGELRSLAEVEDAIVEATPEGDAIRVRDLATVRRGSEDPPELVRLDGRRAVVLAVFMRRGDDVQALAERVHEVLAREQAKLPRWVQVDVLFDQSEGVRARFRQLGNATWQSLLLVALVLFAFFGPRQALVAAIGMPLTILLALVVMGLLGTRLHQLSVVGIVIAIGLLVDNIIVVVENVTDYLQQRRLAPLEAVVRGTREVQGPLISGTLTTVVAFLPLLIMGGDTGAFIFDMPLLVVITLLASLLVALGLTPLCCYLAFGRRLHHASVSARLQAETGLGALRQRAVSAIASAALRWRRRRPLLALATALVLLAGAAAVPLLGFQLFPKADRDMLIVRVEMPKGAALEATDATAERVRAALAELPETAHVVAYVGRAVSHFYYNLPHTETVNEVAQVLWIGRTGPGLRTPEQLAHELRQQLPRVVPEAAVAVREIEQGPLIQAPVVLRLRGDDVEVLRREAAKLRALLRQVPGIVEVHDSYGDDAHALEVDLDLDKARPLGLSRADVAATLAVLLSGASPTVVREGDEDRPVVIRLPRAQRRDIAMLEKLYLRAPLTGALVPLRHVARLRLGTALARIERYDQVRSIDVEAWIEGRVASHVNRDVAALLAQHYRLPAGYELEQAGERKEINESFRRLGIAALFALLFVYVILVAQFDSLVQPAVILSVLPPALAAGMLGLALTGNPIGFFAGVGCASLAGIVVNDGILLLQFINEARASGLPLEEAIDQGTVRRVKPILSTTLTTVGGLLPLAIGGGSLYAPMCTVIICGLLASTAATLVLLPWVYELSDRFVQLAVPSLRRARVLVIDDEPDAIEMLKDLLGERYEVEGTTDPEHAFKLVASFEPDAVVLDYMMPGRDGLELAAVLRELRPGVAIVMLTAYAGTRVTRSGLTHDLGAEAVLRGADAFVSKDDLPEVPAVIEAALVRPPARLAGRLARRLKRLFGGMGRG